MTFDPHINIVDLWSGTSKTKGVTTPASLLTPRIVVILFGNIAKTKFGGNSEQ